MKKRGFLISMILLGLGGSVIAFPILIILSSVGGKCG